MPSAWCSTPAEHRLHLTSRSEVRVKPGAPLEISLELHNFGPSPRRSVLRLIGLGPPLLASLGEVPSSDVLGPTVKTVSFELPRALRPGRNPVIVEWIATDDRDMPRLAFADVLLVVDDISVARIKLVHPRVSGLLGAEFKVQLENTGTEEIVLALDHRSPDKGLHIDFSPSAIVLEAKHLCHATATIRRRPRWLGSTREHVFDVTARASSGTVTAPGSFRQRTVFAPLLFKSAAIVVVLVMAMWALTHLARKVVSGKPASAWVPMSDAPDALAARAGHTATWVSFERPDAPSGLAGTRRQAVDWLTGRSEAEQAVIVWGGVDQSGRALANGAMYSVTQNTWTSLPDLPDEAAREGQRAVWTGDRLVVWGGLGKVTDDRAGAFYGAQFDPVTFRWSVLPSVPLEPRIGFSMIWTGQVLIVFGGVTGDGRLLGDGAILRSGSLRAEPDASPPDPGDLSAGVWSVFGPGDLGTFDGAPRSFHAAAWDGRYMVINGGVGAGRLLGDTYAYDVARNRWQLISNRLLEPRACHQAVASTSAVMFLGGLKAAEVSGVDLTRTGNLCSTIVPVGASDPAAWELTLVPDPADRGQVSFTWKPLVGAPEHLGTDFVATWTGDAVGIVTSVPELDSVAPIIFRAADGSETRQLPSSAQLGFRSQVTAAWVRNRLVVWGGRAERPCPDQPRPEGCPTKQGARFDVPN